jgi:hypothetical protein
MLRGRKAVRAQSTISYKSKALVAFIHNRVFGTDALFIRTKNRVGARSGNARPLTSRDAGRYFNLWNLSLRGRRPVRADHRLCADEKRIRTQSAILDKTRVGLVVDPNRAYCGLMPAALMMRA